MTSSGVAAAAGPRAPAAVGRAVGAGAARHAGSEAGALQSCSRAPRASRWALALFPGDGADLPVAVGRGATVPRRDASVERSPALPLPGGAAARTARRGAHLAGDGAVATLTAAARRDADAPARPPPRAAHGERIDDVVAAALWRIVHAANVPNKRPWKGDGTSASKETRQRRGE